MLEVLVRWAAPTGIWLMLFSRLPAGAPDGAGRGARHGAAAVRGDRARLNGLPRFGSGLGRAAAEEAAGHTAVWLPALYVLVSAVTGDAVLRAGLRIFAGVGRAGALFTDTGGYLRTVLDGHAAAAPAHPPPH
ncbi:hypothetical protein ACWDWU_31235 [Streptomyces sp. NPDC003442]